MAFAEDPFNLLPSCSHRFYLEVLFFCFFTDGSRKNRNCAFILTAKAKGKCVGSVWEAKIGQNNHPSWGDVLHYDANGPLRNLRLRMNGRKQSEDTVKMPNTPWQTSGRRCLIVSHRRALFFSFSFLLFAAVIFTIWGLISAVVISSVLVWSRDARKRTSPEVCIPTATCHFSHGGHKSGLKARKSTQSQERDTAGKLFSCLRDPAACWPLAERATCSADFQRYNRSTFAALLLYLHLSETGPAGCQRLLSGYFVVYSPFVLLKQK